jgi:hypothetical protein
MTISVTVDVAFAVDIKTPFGPPRLANVKVDVPSASPVCCSDTWFPLVVILTPPALALVIFPANVRADPVIAVEVVSNGWCVDNPVDILVSTSVFVYIVAFVSTVLPPLVIAPDVLISPVFVIVHITADDKFLIIKGLVASDVVISKGDDVSKFWLSESPLALPFFTTAKLIYSGPAAKSVNIRLLPVKPLSW